MAAFQITTRQAPTGSLLLWTGSRRKSIKSVEGLELKLDKVETKSMTHDGKPIHKAWAGNKVFLGQLIGHPGHDR